MCEKILYVWRIIWKYTYQKMWSFGGVEDPNKTVTEGMSGKIVDFFEHVEVLLRICSMPLAEPPKKG